MVAAEEQSCWLVCKLTSQAKYKDISIKNLNLQLNPEIADFVTIIDSVGCQNSNSSNIAPTSPDDDAEAEDILCIEPGETYEVLFKLYVDKIKMQAKSFIEDADGLGLGTSDQSAA